MSRESQDIAKALMLLDNKQELESLENLVEELDNVDDEHIEEHIDRIRRSNPKLGNVLAGFAHKRNSGGFFGKHKNNQYHNHHNQGQGKTASVTVMVKRTITKGTTGLIDRSGNPVNLSAPIFGVLEYESLYSRVLQNYLPKDGSVLVKSVSKTADNQSLQIVYQSVADDVEETVLITGVNTIYTQLLRGLQNSMFTIKDAKVILGDIARINQFDQPFNLFDGSIFTAAKFDSISPQEFKTDVLSDNTVRILKGIEIPVNPEKTIIPSIVPVTAPALGATNYYTIVLPFVHIRKDV